ncbi:MAG TPA: DUF1552 domain-containing protein [Gemmataceae bacterium]
MSHRISRRTMLKGLGAAVALPALEIMAPAAASGAASAGLPAGGAPKRLAFFYVPNGVNLPDWVPEKEGPLDGPLPMILRPLEPFKKDVLVLGGLTCDKARANGDGPGDHARAMAAFLTGCQPRKTHGADIRAGISADQWVANHVGQYTRFPSLELGIERGQQAGNCDSGYSCAYSSNLSWRSATTPNAKEVDPKQVFERLFGGGDPKEAAAGRARRERYNESILDLVMEDARRLQGELGAGDRRKLDEYLTGVRELEQRIERLRRERNKPVPRPDMARPDGIPRDLKEHVRLMCDLLVLAFQADLTRVATFPFANEGSNRPYPFIGVNDGHHDLSHHGNNKEKMDKIAKINRFHMEQFAYLVERLRSVKEGDGSLFDQCMLLYGSGNGDGNRHTHHDLPILLVGPGGGAIKGGRHVRFPRETPLTNLFLTLFDVMGAPAERFGDSTGRVTL